MRIIVLSLFVQASAFGIESGSFTIYDGESQIVTTVQQVDRTVLNLQISDLEYEKVSVDGIDQYRIHLPDVFGMSRGAFLSSNNSVIPTITRTIAVPFDSEPAFRVTRSNFVELTDIVLAPAGEEELDSYSGSDRNISLNLESNPVIAETAGMMRDVRIYSLTISPVQYDPENSVLRVYSEIEIEVDHAGSRIVRYGDHLSEAFLPIYRSFLDNPLLFDPIEVTRGADWFIYPDPFLEYVQPIADWKKAKGYHVEMIAKSDIGSNPSYITIKNYIADRFDTCLVKPDYITIIGDVTMPSNYGIPSRSYNNPYGMGPFESDNYYTFLEGNDYFPEILIGRISIDYVSELNSYIDKLFTYERNPYIDDTDWYLRGTVVAYWDTTGYWPPIFTSARITKLWCRDRMLESGYIQVDTLFEHPGNYIPPSQINASINNGVSFVNYRGYGAPECWGGPYYYTYNINQLSNGPMYPVMTSIVCGTGDYGYDVCFGEGWIRYANKGGAGFIGTTNHDTHTRFNNAIDIGIYWGLFSEGVTTIAQAQLMGKMTMYYAFPADTYPNGRVESYFNSYNILGDPELNCWTGVPRIMSVTHADS
ncbi:MAG: C25 family cysteine peptidase, partial [candidate division Zixibacteria bacterium]